MADNFQLKAIITAVDRLSGPLKGMQRQLKGFQKEVSSLALGAAGAGTAIMGALALPVKSAITLESKMADVRKVVDGLDTPDAFKAMTEQVPKIWEKSLSARPSQLMWWEMTALTSAIA